jgi:hypothetical protein
MVEGEANCLKFLSPLTIAISASPVSKNPPEFNER